MDLKINRYMCENITNKDWVLDNGSCYQVYTRTHTVYETHYRIPKECKIQMSKTQFNRLVKAGMLVRFTELEKSAAWERRFGKYCQFLKAWRFNVEQDERDNENV